MKIDDRVEPLVREALQAAVKRDGDRLDTALSAFTDDATRRLGLELAWAICAFVLFDLNEGTRPSDDQVQALAAHVAQSEAWSEAPAEEIESFLRNVLGDESRTVDPNAAVVLTFVVTGALLSMRKRPDGTWWFDYLDQVEAALEAAK